MSADTTQPVSQRTHLFISYASEDGDLASWLARKLAAEGYAVWFDRMKLLGGEPWVHDIDVAIKERTFRFLALLSVNSKDKSNPTKERTCAASVSKRLGIADFIIPLKVDSADVDWQMSDLNYLPFNRGWAEGWRQLLAKLDKLSAPKNLRDGRTLAAATFDAGSDILLAQPEPLFTNILPVEASPEKLECVSLDQTVMGALKDKLDDSWAYYSVGSNDAIAFGPPPKEMAHIVCDSKAYISIAKPEGLSQDIVDNGVLALLERTIRVRLLRIGVLPHPKRRRTYYLPPTFTADGWLRFTGWSGKQRRRKLVGRLTVLRTGKPPEEVHHHFAFEIRRWNLSHHRHAFQVRATLVFSDMQGHLITDKRVGPLRRKLTKNWWNDEWLDRLLAATGLVIEAPAIDGDGVTLGRALLQVTAEKAIYETRLVDVGETSEEDTSLSQATVQLDENVGEEEETAVDEPAEDI